MLGAETELFLKKRISFENSLNEYAYRSEAPAGKLLSHSLNRWFRNQPVISTYGFLKSVLWIFFTSFLKNAVHSNKRLYLLPNKEERIKRLFTPIQNNEDKDFSQFMIINDFYKNNNSIQLLKSFYFTLLSLPKFSKLLSNLCKEHQENKTPFALFFMYILQCLKYDLAKDKIIRLGVKSVVVDLDRSLLGAPIILAAKNLSVTNATLVHGSVLPPFLYVPVIADNIFCWGQFHEQLFEFYDNSPVNYINSGSLASKKIVERSYSTDMINLTFVSQNFSSHEQYDFIKKLGNISERLNEYAIKVCVKAHPSDDIERMQKACNESHILLLDKSVTLEESIDLTSVFLIISSAFVFDAIGAGRPVIFFDTNSGQSELNQLFTKHAEALVAENEYQLFDILINAENQKSNFRIDRLKQFYTEYISNFGDEAAKTIINTLKEKS